MLEAHVFNSDYKVHKVHTGLTIITEVVASPELAPPMKYAITHSTNPNLQKDQSLLIAICWVTSLRNASSTYFHILYLQIIQVTERIFSLYLVGSRTVDFHYEMKKLGNFVGYSALSFPFVSQKFFWIKWFIDMLRWELTRIFTNRCSHKETFPERNIWLLWMACI